MNRTGCRPLDVEPFLNESIAKGEDVEVQHLDASWPCRMDEENPNRPMDYKIEDGVPIPSAKTRVKEYPWEPTLKALSIGQSFVVPCEHRKAGIVRQQLQHRWKKLEGLHFITRRVIDDSNVTIGVRVWRLE